MLSHPPPAPSVTIEISDGLSLSRRGLRAALMGRRNLPLASLSAAGGSGWLLEGGELCVKMLGQRPVAISPNRHRSLEALRTPKGGLLQGVSLHLQDFLPLNPYIYNWDKTAARKTPSFTLGLWLTERLPFSVSLVTNSSQQGGLKPASFNFQAP